MELDFKTDFVSGSAGNHNNSADNFKHQRTESNSGLFESTLTAVRKEQVTAGRESKSDDRYAISKERYADRPEKQEKNKDKVKDRPKTASEDSKKTEAPEKKAPEAKRPDNEEQKDTEAVAADNAPVVDESAEAGQVNLSDEQNASLLLMLAEIAGVAPEEAAAALAKLELKPADLTTPENISRFLVEAKGLSEPVELLKVPNASEMIKNIRSTVNEAINEAIQSAIEPEITHDETAVNLHTELRQQAGKEEVKTIAPPETLSPKIAESSISDEPKDVYESTQTNSATQSAAKPQNSDNNQGQARQNGQPNQHNPEPAPMNEQEHATPVIIHQGEETIVEVNGRTISRAQQSPVSREAANIINQIADKMKIEFKPTVTEIKINLRPNELGSIAVKIVTESGHVTAEIVTENSKVKELVEQNLGVLKQSLKDQGVEVGELSVSVGQQESEERMKQFAHEQEKSKGRMSQIIGKINEESGEQTSTTNYIDESEFNGSTVNYSA